MALSPLHGRQPEFESLLDATQHDRGAHHARLVVLFGRRRVGKTFLLQHVREHLRQQGARAAYVSATREAAGAQLQRFADAIEIETGHRPSTVGWPSFWADVAAIAEAAPLTLFLDEVPYLIESDKSWPSVLQAAWDAIRHAGASARLTLVLTGSAISTMLNLVSSRGALFERPDLLIRLDPFDLPTATSFLRTTSPISAIEAFTACDGYPLLLQRWDPAASAARNLLRLAGDPMGALATNASTLLLDLGETDTMHRVLGAIGRGANKLSEINARAGQRPERPLAVLERSGLVHRAHPVGDNSPKAAKLRIGDNYLRFWFAMVEQNLQLIDGGQGAAVLRSQVPQWENLVADVFEREARSHAVRLADGEAEVGEWWTDRPAQAQIDVVEYSGNRWLRVGEVKWKPAFTLADFRRFQRHLQVAGNRATDVRLAVWAKESVSNEVRVLHPDLSFYSAADVCSIGAAEGS
jgi:uncharacterized protein